MTQPLKWSKYQCQVLTLAQHRGGRREAGNQSAGASPIPMSMAPNKSSKSRPNSRHSLCACSLPVNPGTEDFPGVLRSTPRSGPAPGTSAHGANIVTRSQVLPPVTWKKNLEERVRNPLTQVHRVFISLLVSPCPLWFLSSHLQLDFLSVLNEHSLRQSRHSQLLTRPSYRMFSNLNPIPTFPTYRGPLNVGTAEYEIPIAELPSSSKIPDPNIPTIKFRTFYPAPSSKKNNWSATWLPEPQREWLDAYLAFLRAPPNISKLFSCVWSLLEESHRPELTIWQLCTTTSQIYHNSSRSQCFITAKRHFRKMAGACVFARIGRLLQRVQSPAWLIGQLRCGMRCS
jgi:hypothetical protein